MCCVFHTNTIAGRGGLGNCSRSESKSRPALPARSCFHSHHFFNTVLPLFKILTIICTERCSRKTYILTNCSTTVRHFFFVAFFLTEPNFKIKSAHFLEKIIQHFTRLTCRSVYRGRIFAEMGFQIIHIRHIHMMNKYVSFNCYVFASY